MKSSLLMISLLLAAGLAAFAAASKSQANPEDAAVRQVVEQYLHGLKHNDVESLKKHKTGWA